MSRPRAEDFHWFVVVQLKQTTEAKPQNFRFKYESHTCGGCKLVEYACTGHE